MHKREPKTSDTGLSPLGEAFYVQLPSSCTTSKVEITPTLMGIPFAVQ